MTDEPKLFYILDGRSASSVGNCASWWAPKGQGYVCDLAAAGMFTEEEASGMRETDVPVPVEFAEAIAIRHVRVDTQAMAKYVAVAHAAASKRTPAPRNKRR